MDELWNLRGDVRREQKDEDAMLSDEQRMYRLVLELSEISRQIGNQAKKDQLLKRQAAVLKELEGLEHHLEKTMADFTRLFLRTEQAFTLVLKVCVDLEFQFEKDERELAVVLGRLEQTGFPKRDYDILKATFEGYEKEREAALKELNDIVRRGSGKQTNQLATS
jgi:hypothetical protein